MPIKTSNNTSITRIYGKTAGKHLSQSAIPPINFHSNTDNISYNLSGNMVQASTQEYTLTQIPPIDFMSDGTGISAYSIYGDMTQASSQQYSLTGTSPLSFMSDTTSLTSWTIAGAMQQTGTPTPDAPITPQECGDRTAQLFDASTAVNGYYINDSNGEEKASNGSVCSDYIEVAPDTYYKMTQMQSGNWGAWYDANKTFISGFTGYSDARKAPTGAKYIRVTVNYIGRSPDYASTFMLVQGTTTPETFIPYGYKIPLSLSPTPIYLDEPLRRIGDYADTVSSDGVVTRRIKKLVLTGEETEWSDASGNAPYRITLPDIVSTRDRDIVLFLSTHYRAVSNNASWVQYNTCVSWSFFGNERVKCLQFRDTNQATLSNFKSYLAQQYAAGTPVTVWYVLATPTTETITAPTLTTAKGSNTLTVGTTLSPSSISISTSSGVYPNNPITPEECGDKTENLLYSDTTQTTGSVLSVGQTAGKTVFVLNKNTSQSDTSATASINITLEAGTYTLSVEGLNKIDSAYDRVFIRDKDDNIIVQNVQTDRKGTFTLTEQTKLKKLTFVAGPTSTYQNQSVYVMLNLGSTAQTYEPYGYKIPVTNAGTTTNIYALEPIRKIGDYADVVDSTGSVTRRIKKIVLTGTENISNSTFTTSTKDTSNVIAIRFSSIGMTDIRDNDNAVKRYMYEYLMCSHYTIRTDFDSASYKYIASGEFGLNTLDNSNMFIVFSTDAESIDDFKSYLAAQYANGTPVCVWYVLETPITESITSPALSTNNGNNTLSIGTTLQPSSVSLTTSSSVYPKNPIIPVEVGEPYNLYKDDNVITVSTLGDRYGFDVPDGTYSIRNDTGNIVYYGTQDYANRFSICQPHSTATVTLSSASQGRQGFFMPYNSGSLGGVTIVDGNEIPDRYYPYGSVKIPVSINSTITNIYLNNPIRKIGNYSDIVNDDGTVTRYVKKLVLTGNETYQQEGWHAVAAGTSQYYRVGVGAIGSCVTQLAVCTHFQQTLINSTTTASGVDIIASSTTNKDFLAIRPDNILTDFPDVEVWKSYLATQYANGNPVCVWYVLATPEVETITSPTLTPQEGSNTIDINTTLKPSNLTIGYTAQDYSEIKLVYDNQGNILYNDPPYHDWGAVRWIVRQGLGSQYYPVGYIFYDNFNESTGTAYQVVAHDHHFDPNLTALGYTHSMTCLEVKLNDYMIFDNAEAFLYTDTLIPAGTYKFTIPNYDATYGGNKTYYFTSTADLPAGSQIVMNWQYQQLPETVTAYSPSGTAMVQTITTATTGWNALTLTEYVEGTSPTATDLGTIAGPTTQLGSSNYGQMNHIHRARYGSNNYLQSGIRQYLNSNSAANTWWQPQTIFDRPYGGRTSAGKLTKLNQNLVNVLATPTIQSRANQYFETTSLDGTTFTLSTNYDITTDKLFLLSPMEVNFNTTDTTVGTVLDYYVNATNTDRIKIRTSTGAAGLWWLRTPYPSVAFLVRSVYTSGALSSNYASTSYGCAPAWVIQ